MKREHPFAEWRAASERDRAHLRLVEDIVTARQELDKETLADLRARSARTDESRAREQAKHNERLARHAYLAHDGGLPELIEWEEALDRLLALDPDALG